MGSRMAGRARMTLRGGGWFRGAALAAWLGAALLASGCWDRREIETLGVVTAVAFDLPARGEGIRMTALFAIPSRLGGGRGAGIGGGMAGAGSGPLAPFARVSAGPLGPTAWVVGVQARTLSEAQEEMARLSPRLPFWAHVRLVVIGEAMARAGVARLLDPVVRDREFRITPWVTVARDAPAHRLLELPSPLNAISSEGIVRLLQSQSFQTASVRAVRIRDMVIDLMEPGVEPVAPALSFEKPVPPDRALIPSQEPGPPAFPVTRGTAVFRGDRLVGWLDPTETTALILLRGESRPFTLTAPCPEGPGEASVRFIRALVRRRLQQPGASQSKQAQDRKPPAAMGARPLPEILLDISADGNLMDATCQPPLGSAQRPKLEQELARQLTRQLQGVVDRLHRELRADAAGFGQMIARADPSLWEHLRPLWPELLPHLQVRIQMEARVRRTGLLNGRVDF